MSTPDARRTNRLALETSPYLLQHAHNPVDWLPWGPEALERARTEDKPILLSIGYAACHWCHVMERESFENEAIAASMNEGFVCVKVDREERPDLDDIYMAATVAMTGHGGWPMTVFLTPDQRPFFAGTYFPPDDRHGNMGFASLLARIADMWKTSRDQLLEQAGELTEHVRAHSTTLPGSAVGEEALDAATADLLESFDPEWGGFGKAPKFPPCAALELLLRVHRRTPEPTLLGVVQKTLNAMKDGGIYDHVGGGFARYSTDERWLVPHFEKMLYDNAQLTRVYLQAFQVTGDPEYRRVAVETLDYVIREMQGPEGGFYSATDADSEGVEGKFFVWNQDEIDAELGRPESEWFCLHHDVSPSGNWEGVNILNTPRSVEDDAGELGISPDTLRASIATSKAKLYAARQRRVPPLTDDKVLASWNGLMIGAMAEGARVLGDRRYLESAERAGRFVLGALTRPDGGLFRTARAGKAHLDGYLEDYAFVADGLADLYEAGGDETFVRESERLAERMIEDFAEAEGGAFFQTARTHEALIARTREGHDGAIPNGNAVAARVLARLAAHFGRTDFKERAIAAIAAYGRSIERSPRAFCTTLGVVDFLLEAPVELALVGPPESEAGKELAGAVGVHYLPNRIVAHASDPELASHPLLAGKALVQGGPALYVCRDFTCQAPVASGADVPRVLGDALRSLAEARARLVGDRRLTGAASKAATSVYAARFEAARGKAAFTLLGSTELTVSRAGFGSYRVDDRVRTHREALRTALTSGVNLIDTSTNYADGHSERLIGEVLAELAAAGALGRDELVVVSKIGYAQGQNLELLAAREAGGKAIPEVVAVGEGLAHCIHPEWIADQLGRSLSRLGLSTLDVCLLHNPEYFLADAAKRGVPLEEARTEFYRRVTEAFRQLEREAVDGRILFYGVSSNTAVEEASRADATDVARFVEAARAAGGDAHHFRVLQVPMNLFESGGALTANAGPESSETAASVALRNGVAVLVNRPLNGIKEDRLIRLADPPVLPEAPNLGEQLTAVRSLEQEFAKVFAPALRPGKNAQIQPKDLFKWADALGDAAMRIDSFETFRDIETRQVAPRIVETMSALERAMTGPLGAKFAMWRERYLTEMEGLFASLRHRAADRSLARSRSIGAAIDPFLPDSVKKSSLSRKALRVLLDVPGVTSVLVGMRHTDYVQDVLEALALEPAARAPEALAAMHNAEIR